jgi:hypothetical protein
MTDEELKGVRIVVLATPQNWPVAVSFRNI